ncbi:MAG: CsgG/HfaB family protein [Phycisphaerales bacterium]
MQRIRMHLALLTVLAPLAASGALCAQTPAEKPRLAIRAIAATPAVQAQAKSEGTDNALMQVEQGADPQLLDALAETGRFELVARSDLPSVSKEQDLTLSGNVNVMDPQAARAFQLAGARYVATVTIGNFQDISERTELLNQFGTSKAERRTIDLQATVKIFDTTTGALFRSTTVTLSEAATNEIMPGVEQKGSKTNVVLGQAAARLAREAAARIAGSIPEVAAAPSGGAAAPGGSASASTRPLRLAIFVKQRPGCIPAEKVPVFEDLVTAAVTGPSTEIIRREDVVNAVNRFAREGANAGTVGPDAETVDRLLSDRTSASQLAAQMGADLILTASISQLQTAKRRLDDPSTGTATDVEQWTLIATYGVLDGATGASKTAGTVQADFANRSTRELKVEVDAVDQVLRDAAARIGPPVRMAIESGRATAATAAAEVQVRFSAVLADLSVPDVRIDASGQYSVGANNYQLAPMDVQVIVDGVAIGNAPGSLPLRPGIHRARFQRPGLEPVEMVINAREGLAVSVPMQLSPEGRANWQRDAAFFNDLKNGAVLRDAELIKIRAIADFLKQSSVRIDTTNVQNLNVGGQSLWWQLIP